MNEAETRAEYIDPSLALSGWGTVENSQIRREYPIYPGRLEGSQGRRGKPLTADYVLVYKNIRLATIEAKAYGQEVSEGVGQAKNYASKLSIRFTYSTNGRGIYAIDMLTGKEEDVPKFPTPEELWNRTFEQVNEWRNRFTETAFPDKGGTWDIRYYQETAVNRVLEKIAKNEKRILLTLATGTGKTAIAFQIAWKLFKSWWNLSGQPTRRPRILFLADRNNLASQAYNDFSSFNAFADDAMIRIKPSEIKLRQRVPTNGSIFFTIFQTFMSGQPVNGKPSPYFGNYPKDFFDFIVIDECHRGGANDESTWREILEYFSPAVQLGLTATPKRTENIDTYAYFGEPVYTYSLKEGINDGFLTPFRVKEYTTSLDEYVYTADDDVLQGEIDTGRRYTEAEFNKIIEIREREAVRVKLFMDQISQSEKTIVFCATQAHALAVRDLINQMKTSTSPDYCHRVTSDEGEIGDTHLREFQDNEKTIPTILTTSQKLSTGVDARNIRNIVLMRPVNSMIEFKQIIGRGTRLHDNKDYFTIHDFVKAHLHFHDEDWDGEPVEPDPKQEHTPIPEKKQKPPLEPPVERPAKIKVKLADGKERTIQHMMCTTFWHPDGTPMSAQQFMEVLFGKLPDFFKSEAELRDLWSSPITRKKLLEGLAENGFGKTQLEEMQKIIEAEKSDIFDVLAFVAYAMPTFTREERASEAKKIMSDRFSTKQKGFLEFVLGHYISVGVEELAVEKLTSLLRLKYNDSISDAVADLGEDIGKTFTGFQQYLYLLGAIPKVA